MVETSNGVRFEVYERVKVSAERYGIAELEDIELTPNMQVVQLDQQVIVRGKLVLEGTYRPDLKEQPDGVGVELQQLHHLIPVEITLPISKVNDLNALSVVIDQFDVDIITPRTLQVTGVLTLTGVHLQQQPMPVVPEPPQLAATAVEAPKPVLVQALQAQPPQAVMPITEPEVEVQAAVIDEEPAWNDGSGPIQWERLLAAPEEATKRMRIIIVQQTDSLDSLAERYNVTVRELQQWNRTLAAIGVEPGQVLLVHR